jgi:hypothetical protein
MESAGYSETLTYIYQTTRHLVLDIISSPVYSLLNDVLNSLDLRHVALYCRVSSELVSMW